MKDICGSIFHIQNTIGNTMKWKVATVRSLLLTGGLLCLPHPHGVQCCAFHSIKAVHRTTKYAGNNAISADMDHEHTQINSEGQRGYRQ